MSIGIIGFGNMGSALCEAFIKNKISSPKNIFATDSSPEKLQSAKKKYGITIATDLKKLASVDILFFAVKPQTFEEVALEIKGNIPKKTIVISIMAGVGITKMKKLLGHQRIVRSMPNTPAMVGEGVTGWFADKSIASAGKKKVQTLFEATGMAIEVKKETLLNDFTCLSGSGPGFFFYVFEQWIKATKELDLPSDQTAKILAKTIQGSLKLLELSGEKPEQLRSNVTSKGGTTEAGLEILQKAKLENLFAKTLKAAYNRCKNLG